MSAEVERRLIGAIFARRAAADARGLLADDGERLSVQASELARAVVAACETMRTESIAEQRRMVERWQGAGLAPSAVAIDAPARLQFHSFEVGVEPSELDRALGVAETEGYLRWAPRTGAAWESFRRTHDAVTLVRTDAVTTRAILRWAIDRQPGRVTRWLRPTARDYRVIDLPPPAWPLYHVVRPVRLALDRLTGRRHRDAAWPYLGTPDRLVGSLLDFAAVGPNDRLVDLGCGDGRVLIEAARSRGCECRGIERDPALVALARQRVSDAAVSDRVEVVAGDATTADVEDASVVFLFLPPEAVRSLLPELLRRLPHGARIVTHEQMALPPELTPDRSAPLVADNALTVGHLWTIA